MKRTTILFLAFLLVLPLSSIVLAGDECCEKGDCGSICVEGVKLKLSGNFQSMFVLKANEDDSLGPNDEFKMGRARLILKGEVMPDKFYLYTQFEMNSANPLRDCQFIYTGLPVNSSVSLGRMKPDFTYYMPRNTARLDFIHYPLMVQHFAMNWQMGVQTTTKVSFLKFNLGVFNGQDIPNNMNDNNKYKDYFIRADAKHKLGPGKAMFGLYYWDGTANKDFYGDEVPGKIALNRLGFVLGYKIGMLNVMGEYLTAKQDVSVVNWSIFGRELNRNSYYFQAGYKFMEEKLEALVRYDTYDQSTDIDDNEQQWTTVGVNYYLNSWKTMIYFNYIMRETGDSFIDEQGSYKDGLNDLIMFQAQMAF